MNPLERNLIVSIGRLAELAKFAANNNQSHLFFTGVMFSLSILYEEFTGRRLQTHDVRPQDIFDWAQRVRETGELPRVNTDARIS